jgi:hypothetical protein
VVSVTPRPRFYPRGKDPGTHFTGGWVGPRAGLDTEARGNILWPRRGSNPDRPVVQPIVRHYTTWANPAPVMWQEPVFTHWAVLRHWVHGLRFTEYRANIHGTRLVCTLQALMEMWSSVREETKGWTDRRRDEHITHCTFMLYTFGAKNIQMPRRGCVLYKLHTEVCWFSRIFQGPFFLHYTVPISDFVFNSCVVPCQNPFTDRPSYSQVTLVFAYFLVKERASHLLIPCRDIFRKKYETSVELNVLLKLNNRSIEDDSILGY